jgi:hypothetical protein
MKATLFRQVAIHGFTRQLIRAPAGLVGHLGKLRFLLDAELHCHNSRLGAFGLGVKSDLRRALPLFCLAEVEEDSDSRRSQVFNTRSGVAQKLSARF